MQLLHSCISAFCIGPNLITRNSKVAQWNYKKRFTIVGLSLQQILLGTLGRILAYFIPQSSLKRLRLTRHRISIIRDSFPFILRTLLSHPYHIFDFRHVSKIYWTGIVLKEAFTIQIILQIFALWEWFYLGNGKMQTESTIIVHRLVYKIL